MLRLALTIALGIVIGVIVLLILMANVDELRELRTTLVSVPITIRDGDGSAGLLSLFVDRSCPFR